MPLMFLKGKCSSYLSEIAIILFKSNILYFYKFAASIFGHALAGCMFCTCLSEAVFGLWNFDVFLVLVSA
ncbi:hypothetical protein VNO77_01089 [Canavalia gladiata]|uniref:Uncharacterized protein n=1 Tax=Canavalia gladiata TaxID=3824 RepID=A0AAN9MRA0_CANGL